MADEKETSADTTAGTQTTAGGEVPQSEATPAAGAAPEQATSPQEPPPSAEAFAEMKDKLLRTLAEMENLRRRTTREIADTRQYAVANFAREMLAVGDNLRRAIEAVPAEMRDGGDKALAALIEGVEVTERSLAQSLAKFGVKRIEARGEKFDPSMHQAMLEVETDAVEPGKVADEIQTGYVIGERVLRPALVAVAKKTAPPAQETPAGEDSTEAPASSGTSG